MRISEKRWREIQGPDTYDRSLPLEVFDITYLGRKFLGALHEQIFAVSLIYSLTHGKWIIYDGWEKKVKSRYHISRRKAYKSFLYYASQNARAGIYCSDDPTARKFTKKEST